MFRNKILVRAHLPSPSFSPFLLLQLSLSDSSSPIEIETLCWKLSRRWRLACFLQSPSSVFVIYQRSQTEAAALVVEELAKTLAVCNRVQPEIDGLVFLVSPDVIWFTRDKITDLIASRALQNLHDGNIALVEKDRLFTACIVLPSLYNGRILGLSKLPPVGENFELLEELWKFKHGLSLSSDYYVNVHFSYGGHASKQWLPSAFLLRGSGLSPAPQTVRSSMAVNALNSFIDTIGCSDFFSQGLLKMKEVSSLETPMMQPVWKAVGTACNDNKSITSATDQCLTSQNLNLTLDFRARKPAPWFISTNKILDHDKNHSAAVLTSEGMTETTMTVVFKPPIPKPLNEVVQVAAKPPPLSQSQTYQRESGYLNDIISIVKPASAASNEKEESVLQQKKVDNLRCSSKDVRDKMMSDTLNHNSSSKDQKAEKSKASSKRTFDKENKSKEGKSEASMKMKTKQHIDSADVNSKVIEFHARGKLQSLTVSDLKCFLVSKKMKVGGKKEELIQRVTIMLG